MSFNWISVGIFVFAWNIAAFFIKKINDDRQEKRKAALEFLTKVNINIYRERNNYICDLDKSKLSSGESFDVCVSSYTAYRMTLKGDRACRFDKCWTDYIDNKAEKTDCLECLICLKQIVEEEINCGHGDGLVPSKEYLETLPKCGSCGQKSKSDKLEMMGNLNNEPK